MTSACINITTMHNVQNLDADLRGSRKDVLEGLHYWVEESIQSLGLLQFGSECTNAVEATQQWL
jgi:hypothetical protein